MAKKDSSREVQASELTVAPREVSSEDLKAMEKAQSEVTVRATEDVKYDGTSVKGADVPSAQTPSPDSADYTLQDVGGTAIVGYQEQVPKG